MDLLNRLFTKRFGPDEYATLVSKALADTGVATVRYDEKSFSLHGPDGLVLHLQGGYSRFCAADSRDRHTVLMDLVSDFAAMASIPADFASAKEYLLPVVRSAAFFPLARLQSQASGKADTRLGVAAQRVADDLVVCLAYDAGGSVSYIGQKSLDRWQVGFPEALTIARDNLRERTDPSWMAQPSPGLYVGQWGDSYESSRMLLTDLIHRLPLDGDPVVSVPSRNQLWVTGSRNASGLDSTIKFCQKEHFGAYPLSPHLFVLHDREWGSFIPGFKASRDSLRHIELRRAAADYGLQKGYLDAMNEKEAKDLFVASCTVYEESVTERQYSVCIWSKGVDSLLPLTDEVILVIDPETKDRVSVKWSIAQSVVGRLMEKQDDLLPERYRVRSFPSQEEIAELRRATSA